MPLLLGPVRGRSRTQGAGKGRRVSRAKEWAELQVRTNGRYGKKNWILYERNNGNGELTETENVIFT